MTEYFLILAGISLFFLVVAYIFEIKELREEHHRLKSLFITLVQDKLGGEIFWYSKDIILPFEIQDMEDIVDNSDNQQLAITSLANALGYRRVLPSQKPTWEKVKNSKERKS